MSLEDLPENSFAIRMKVLVELVGSAEKLARLSGMSARVIGKYLAGETDPSRERLIALAGAAGVTVAWLATGEGPMKRGEEVRSSLAGDPQPLDCAPLQTNSDPEIAEIVDILKHDLPEAKRFVLKVLRGRKETKEGLEGLGLKLKEE